MFRPCLHLAIGGHYCGAVVAPQVSSAVPAPNSPIHYTLATGHAPRPGKRNGGAQHTRASTHARAGNSSAAGQPLRAGWPTGDAFCATARAASAHAPTHAPAHAAPACATHARPAPAATYAWPAPAAHATAAYAIPAYAIPSHAAATAAPAAAIDADGLWRCSRLDCVCISALFTLVALRHRSGIRTYGILALQRTGQRSYLRASAWWRFRWLGQGRQRGTEAGTRAIAEIRGLTGAV